MGLKETLRKAAGLLVELPPEEPAAGGLSPSSELSDLLADLEGNSNPVRTVDQIVREAEGPNLDQITIPTDGPPPVAADGTLDFAAVYQSANLPPSPFSAEQMLGMLASLPAELPLDTKRQTVIVTLASLGKSMGASPDTIVSDASRKLAALHAYVESLSAQTTQFVSTAEGEIAALQAQIEEKRKAIQDAKLKLAQVSQSCDAESDRLDDVLEFFSLDVAPSKYAAPGGAP